MKIKESFSLEECRSMPDGWGQVVWTRYKTFVKKASFEDPPGFNRLMVGLINGVFLRDRQVLEKSLNLVKRHSKESDLLEMYGSALFAVGCQEEGKEKLRQAIQINNSVGAIVALCQLLEDPSEFDEKLELCKRALEIDPNDTDALMSAFSVHLLREEISEAEGYVRKAMRVSPKKANVIEGYAEILFHKKDYKQAIKYYKKSLKQYWCRDDKQCWQQIAACHYYLNDMAKAKVAAIKMKEACIAEGLPPDDPGIIEVYNFLEMPT